MTDEIPTMMDIAYVDGLIHDLQRGGHVVKLVKVGHLSAKLSSKPQVMRIPKTPISAFP